MASHSGDFNLREVIDACAKHAWETRSAELEHRGIGSEIELRTEIERVVHDPDTKAFYGYYDQTGQKAPEQVFKREIYELRPYSDAQASYGMTVILNPNRDPETGLMHGGTCFVRDRPQIQRLSNKERDDTGMCPEIVIGGRAALQEREQHRQLAVVECQPKREPTMIEKMIQERQKTQTQAPVPQPKPPSLDR